MKLLTDLKCKAVPAEVPPLPGAMTALHDEPQPGFFRTMTLSHRGLTIRNTVDAVEIPLAELWKLAEKHAPGLKPPAES